MLTNRLCFKHECQVREMMSEDTISVALMCLSSSGSTKVLLDLEKCLDGSRVCALLLDSTPSLRSGRWDRAFA